MTDTRPDALFAPFEPRPMPTPDELRHRDLAPRVLDTCLLFVAHGINPDEVPDPASIPDVFTDAGYLVAIGWDRSDSSIVTERRAWPEGVIDALRELLA